MDEEYIRFPHLDKDREEDVFKANLCLVGIITSFAFLTLLAYLLNEGRHLLVIPMLRRFNPSCKWVIEYDRQIALGDAEHSPNYVAFRYSVRR